MGTRQSRRISVDKSGVVYASLVPDESRRKWIARTGKQAARRLPRGNRLIWLVILVLVIVACAEAVATPSKRTELLSGIIVLVGSGWMVSESRRSRRERDALATRLALSRGDIPAPVIDLLLAGQKIQAIKCYREETGVSLKEAKGLIDSL